MGFIKVDENNIDEFEKFLTYGYEEDVLNNKLQALGYVTENQIPAGIMLFEKNEEQSFLLHAIIFAPEYYERSVVEKMIEHLQYLAFEQKTDIFVAYSESDTVLTDEILLENDFVTERTEKAIYETNLSNLDKADIDGIIISGYEVLDSKDVDYLVEKRYIQQNEQLGMYKRADSDNQHLIILYLVKNEEIVGVMVVSEDKGTKFEIDYLHTEKDSSRGAISLMNKMKQRMKESAKDENALVSFAVTKDSTDKLAMKLLGNVFKKTYYRIGYWKGVGADV